MQVYSIYYQYQQVYNFDLSYFIVSHASENYDCQQQKKNIMRRQSMAWLLYLPVAATLLMNVVIWCGVAIPGKLAPKVGFEGKKVEEK